MTAVRLGVSACLLGAAVRFDGGHKRDAFLAETLAPFVTWVPVCPEDEAGLGTPREPMRLISDGAGVRLLTIRSARDVTPALEQFSARRVAQLASERLDGFVLKKDSPSCGAMRVKVHSTSTDAVPKSGTGVFASALTAALPFLPIEEEGRLCNPAIREHFFERVFAHRRWRLLIEHAPRVRDVMAFHSRHKLLLLAHSPKAYQALGRLVASARPDNLATLLDRYRRMFHDAIATPAPRPRHVNVLQHVAGYFRRDLDPPARQQLHGSIIEYEKEIVPLIVPVTLLAHYARLLSRDYLLSQVYFEPHPKEMRLRHHS